jgi:PAS domain S-box-containing protein
MHSRCSLRPDLAATALTCIVSLCLAAGALGQPASPTHKRVLVFHFARPDAGAFVGVESSLRDALADEFGDGLELTSEYLDLIRFADPAFQSAMREYLKMRYAHERFDEIIAASPSVLQFLDTDPSLFPGVPVVFLSRPGVVGAANSTGVVSAVDFKGSLAEALRLRPDTRDVFVVSGTSEFDHLYEALFRSDVATLEGPHRLTYLSGLPMRQLDARVRELPPHSLVYYVSVSTDGTGNRFLPIEALERLSAAANAPVFSWHEAMLGHGIVGGLLHSSIKDSEATAAVAARVLNGESASDIPVAQLDAHVYKFDWRQLARWHIPDNALPAGSDVRFRQYTFWETYRLYLLGGAILFAAQLALIVGLVVQRGSRRRAEARSRNNEELYRSVVDTQTELICRFLPDSTLTFVNDAYCRFSDRSREHLLGKKFAEMIPATTRQTVLDRIANIRQGFQSHEHEVTLPDGTIGWHRWTNHAIVDERGAVVELQGVGHDITDYKRAEAAARLAEERNTAILRAIPDLMFVLLRDGTYVDYHARDESVLLVPPSVFIGRTVRDIMPPALAETFMEAIERALAGDEMIVVEYQLTKGESDHFEARIVQAGADRVLAIVRDVTDSKRAAQRNNELAGRLIASQEDERRRIARELHDDVSQSMALLMIGIDQLAARCPGERHAFRELTESAREISLDLHNLSHELHPSKLHALGLLSALKSLCRDMSQQTRLAVVFTHETVPNDVDADVSLCMYRITQEALHNVARHSHAQQAEVHLATDGHDLTLRIADSGVGFDLQNGHTGLGLVSIRERAALLRGEVVVHTSPGGGTRIGVRVPVRRANGSI